MPKFFTSRGDFSNTCLQYPISRMASSSSSATTQSTRSRTWLPHGWVQRFTFGTVAVCGILGMACSAPPPPCTLEVCPAPSWQCVLVHCHTHKESLFIYFLNEGFYWHKHPSQNCSRCDTLTQSVFILSSDISYSSLVFPP